MNGDSYRVRSLTSGGVGILKCPTCPNCRSDDFLGGAGTSERFYSFGEGGQHVIGDAPRCPKGAPGRRLAVPLASAGRRAGREHCTAAGDAHNKPT